MASRVYVAGIDPSAGKSVVALGVAELLSRRVGRFCVFRSLGAGPDPLLDLLVERYRLEVEPSGRYGVSRTEALELLAAGQADELTNRIVARFRAFAAGYDAALIIGGDLDQHDGAPHEAGFDARVATQLGAALIGVLDGRHSVGTELVEQLRAQAHDLRREGAEVLAMVANRVPADRITQLRAALVGIDPPGYAIAEVPELTAPSVAEVATALSAKRLLGDDAALAREIHGFMLGGAGVPVFLEHLRDGVLVITPGDRADLIVAAFSAHAAGSVSLAGILLTLGEPPDPRVVALVERLATGLALLLVPQDSFTAVTAISQVEASLSAANPRTVQAALGAFETAVAADPPADATDQGLATRIVTASSVRVTPLMFEYGLIERARTRRRHVVLPEGTEERILRAAEVVLRRDVADLTLLGDPDEITRRARELGLDIRAAQLVDPATSPWRTDFGQLYAELRRHKGISPAHAHERVADATYFGTLMVHTGHADAMVSGAAHPTADTIRPAFEIIKTVPGVSVASSVFFMCLADRVLVYGDCAIVPDPTAQQLADIAISSAGTAARFGVQPRIAMLSYSTGTSGSGADVDKVAAATALVRERRPDLLADGPIQYDAAVDPQVAAAKRPGSPVAGQATVLIFPDLNTGNNTYKAVQRSAHAVAVGPILQGLRRPVNDLSRGATVRDIVNTIAITAIQAADDQGDPR